MKIYDKSEIRTIHLEMTDNCNAACPMCSRNNKGYGTTPLVAGSELSLEDFKRLVPPDFADQLKHVYYCGNYGDAVTAKDCLPISQYLRDHDVMTALHTNGGARSEKWWRDATKVINHVVFAVDGLDDTNHLYRQKVNWNVLWRNMNIWAESGNSAEWVFIPFKHNEHQIDKAQVLCQKLGFRFILKRSTRWYRREIEKYKVFFPDKKELSHEIEPPSQQEYKTSIPREIKNWDINRMGLCKSEGQIFISAKGEVFPCCWIGDLIARGLQQDIADFDYSGWNFFEDDSIQDWIMTSWMVQEPLEICQRKCR